MSNAITRAHTYDVLTYKLALIFLLMFLLITASSMATADNTSEIAYVDSVTKWGAWELDIEPAAGGLAAPSTGALNARGSKVSLRTNSIAALAPPQSSSRMPNAPAPTTPIVPPAPQIPTVTPISPSVPVPVGAP